jgi:lycopene beta-cyclase
MTDMRVVNQDYCFTYLLPMSNHRLLIELTLFSTQPHTEENLQSAFNQLLDDRGYRNANILRTEFGILPMGLPEDKSELPRAGMGGGALRPSSGYGFMRIQRWAKQCADYYCAHDDILAQTSSSFILKKMDQLFLDVLRSQPQRVPTLFYQLLGQTNTERFIRFMNDRAHSLDYFNIVTCLPKGPFIKALLLNLFPRR